MKANAAIIVLLLACYQLSAQQVTEQSLPWTSEQAIHLDLKYAETITIEAWNKNEVYFKAQYSINDGHLDSAHFVTKTTSNDLITIEAGLQEALIKKGSNWHNCNGRKSISYGNFSKGDHCNCVCTDIHYTLYIPAGADLELETITGDVKITNMKAGIEAKSVSGKVEVFVTANHKADVQLKTVMGRVASYPDLTIVSEDGLRPLLTRKLSGKLNGGGKRVTLESVTGSVLLKSGS